MRSDFHYDTYIGISPYRTLAVVELQSMTVIYHMWLDGVRNTNTVHFSCDMGKYSTHIALKWTPFAYQFTFCIPFHKVVSIIYYLTVSYNNAIQVFHAYQKRSHFTFNICVKLLPIMSNTACVIGINNNNIIILFISSKALFQQHIAR